VFDSYDDETGEKNFISQYKNLFHHFVHQQSNTEAVTFWAGCGAIRQEIFDKVGGFDTARYARPSIEDIELGYWMRRMGYRLMLDNSYKENISSKGSSSRCFMLTYFAAPYHGPCSSCRERGW
jgi:GT2 family glycosyltransferase